MRSHLPLIGLMATLFTAFEFQLLTATICSSVRPAAMPLRMRWTLAHGQSSCRRSGGMRLAALVRSS